MIISRTPYRISLFGGSTDFPEWYRENPGAVIGFALNKYCWITLRELYRFFDYRYRVVYSRFEEVNETNHISHPVIRAVLSDLHNGLKNGFEIHHDGEIPSRTGLGTSSSFTVGFIHLIHNFYRLDDTKRSLASSAIHLEQNILKESVGSQDQIWAAYGGFNRIDFKGWKRKKFTVKPYICMDTNGIPYTPLGQHRVHTLINHLMMFFTSYQRTAAEIEAKKIENIKRKKTQLQHIYEHVNEAENIIKDEKRPIEDIGLLLNETWQMKKELADSVSFASIDQIYTTALRYGATGGKLLGAGGGGFFLLFVKPELQDQVRKGLSGLVEVPVGIDWEGSKIIYPS